MSDAAVEGRPTALYQEALLVHDIAMRQRACGSGHGRVGETEEERAGGETAAEEGERRNEKGREEKIRAK